MRRFALFLASVAAFAQTPAPLPSFEVASIKPAGEINAARIAAGGMKIGMTVDAARVDIGFMSLSELIQKAFRVKSYEVSGPDWMNTTRFNIQATIPEGVSKDLAPEMLQSLLAERFKLTFHREKREQNVYALVPGKNGPKLKESEPDSAKPAEENAPSNQLKITGNPAGGRGVTVATGGRGNVNMRMTENGVMRMQADKMSMSALAEMLTRFVDRPVVDMTGLTGNYQVGLDLSMDELRAVAMKAGAMMVQAGVNPATPIRVAPEGDGASASIFTSVQQLGLKLEGRKTAIDTIVVDHIEKTPTEN